MNRLKDKKGFMMIDAIIGIIIVVVGLAAILYTYQKGNEVNVFTTRSDESIELAETWMGNMRACDGALAYTTSYDSEYYDLMNQAVLKVKDDQDGESDDELKDDYNFKYTFSGSATLSDGTSQTLNEDITGWNKYKNNDTSSNYSIRNSVPLFIKATSFNTGLEYLIKAEFVKSSDITADTVFDPERRINVSVSSLTSGSSKTRTINLYSYIHVVES